MKKAFVLLAVAAGLAACTDDPTTGPIELSRTGVLGPTGARGFKVMTQNVYPGAVIEAIMDPLDPRPVPVKAAEVWGKVQYTNFPERAAVLADKIAADRPHVIGLQEVPIYRIQDPGDMVAGGSIPAEAVALDFLQILIDALDARGVHYVAVAVHRTTDIEVPVAKLDAQGDPTGFMDIRFTDGDAILVRSDVPYANAVSGIYQAAIPGGAVGLPTDITRGWDAVDATVGGITYRFFNTHLEDMSVDVQVGQAAELLGMIGAESKPVVLTGDFNSDAFTNPTPTYGMLLEGGMSDLWSLANPRDPGATCCHVELLDEAVPSYTKRLDLILTRGGLVRNGLFVGNLQASLVGEKLSDRTPSGLWISDHVGVMALMTPPIPGAR
jgi:endonuclease/exonuclease/phosphatase family metal-dependent hydrolase